jgi:hypothetical protein
MTQANKVVFATPSMCKCCAPGCRSTQARPETRESSFFATPSPALVCGAPSYQRWRTARCSCWTRRSGCCRWCMTSACPLDPWVGAQFYTEPTSYPYVARQPRVVLSPTVVPPCPAPPSIMTCVCRRVVGVVGISMLSYAFVQSQLGGKKTAMRHAGTRCVRCVGGRGRGMQWVGAGAGGWLHAVGQSLLCGTT